MGLGNAMPVVEIHLIEGYDAAVKQRLGDAMTKAVCGIVPAPPEAITVMIHEVPPEDYFRGGERRDPAPALSDPCETVRAFLSAMEARDLDRAQSMLGEDFVMVFPGTAPMRHLQELVDWARPRYHYVRKSYAGFDQAQSGARQVVYARGTLEGEWPDGSAFGGIRFIDRFELSEGRILRQDVWNDIAEVRGT